MIFHTFAVGPLQCNCIILGCEKTREAIVIDPGDEAERILAALQADQMRLKAILHTHAHLDHVGAAAALAAATGAPILLHAGDTRLYDLLPEQAAAFGFETPSTGPVDRYIKDGESLPWGEHGGEVLHTPGHSPGGICLRVAWPGTQGSRPEPDRLFVGDTLFAGSIGRTDLWGGDHGTLIRSIRQRLLVFPDDAIVLPGHGPPTTIGRERRTNPFLTGL